ncbi:hypothetical protein M4951_07270 [Blastopirellula sp. J2-11]|uniref:hypothetical protein n=1 Tax=Blastopirellula sp. J2-11 TaxID=2943192 RepID=UPI0021C582F3|nr:hypothetical protein [Blastopirellula sp. J2-11]UUO08110.1 hypothetical protein M4951_07270 [Blastopirellula sp. J2-11]
MLSGCPAPRLSGRRNQYEIERQREELGEDFGIMQMAIAQLRQFGIHYIDAKPRNIHPGRPNSSR